MTTQVESRTQNVEEIDTAFRIEEIDLEELKRLIPGAERVIRALNYEPDPEEIRYGRPLPMQLIRRYALLATQRAVTEKLDDGSWYAEVAKLPGVWAQGASEKETLTALESVVRDWALLKIVDQDKDLPVIDEVDLNVL